MKKNVSAKSLANLTPWKKGVSANPGGGPKGKRVSTWMAEYGEMDPRDWPLSDEELPTNARIALRRLRCAMIETTSTANSEYVEPRKSQQNTILPIPVTKDSYQELVKEFWSGQNGSERP